MVSKQINLSHLDPQDILTGLLSDPDLGQVFCWRAKESSLICFGLGVHPDGDAHLEDEFSYYSMNEFENSTKPSTISIPLVIINYIEGHAHVISQDAPESYFQQVLNCLKAIELNQRDITSLEVQSLKTPEQELKSWNETFQASKKLITEKNIEKVVISRTKVFEHSLSSAIDISLWTPIKNNITNQNQYFILLKRNDQSLHLSFTPETLIKRSGNNFQIDALAGTRKVSKIEDEDLAIEKELLNNKKELKEHRLVEEFIESVLNSTKVQWQKTKSTGIKKLEFVQHLHSKYSGKVPTEKWEELKALLHPTPAVGARPYQYWTQIEQIEKRKRGLYSGTIGWHNKLSEDICVNLRCLDINSKQIILHAGCGILEQSEMTHEYIETERKMFNFSQFMHVLNHLKQQDTQTENNKEQNFAQQRP